MKVPAPIRITEFVATLVLVAAAIVLTERYAWKQISRLREEMRSEAIQQGRTADRLTAALVNLHVELRAPSQESTEDPEVLREGIEALLQREIGAASGEKRRILEELRSEFQTYTNSGSALETATGEARSVVAQEQDAQFRQLHLLCEQLRVHDERSIHNLWNSVSSRLTSLQRFLFVALLGLVVSGLVLLGFAYRRTIRPLRSSLAESRTLMERQEKLASLGVFAAGIAHEIRNPITAIKVRLFTLKTSHQPGSGESEDLEVIESEINRLERIVQDFLRFARPAEPELMEVNVDAFLREVYELLLPEFRKRGVRFELVAEADEKVRIDPEKMKQVVLNFAHNAADAIESEDGVVTLRSHSGRRIVDGRLLPAVIIDIIDTGKGMPPEVQRRLFDPFFTTKESGTGLGLPVAARIVEKHGGLIQYDTEPGRGTTFSILLPRAHA